MFLCIIWHHKTKYRCVSSSMGALGALIGRLSSVFCNGSIDVFRWRPNFGPPHNATLNILCLMMRILVVLCATVWLVSILIILFFLYMLLILFLVGAIECVLSNFQVILDCNSPSIYIRWHLVLVWFRMEQLEMYIFISSTFVNVANFHSPLLYTN